MSCKKYYKIIMGYGAENYISISEDELEKAQYCFLEKKDSLFSGGAVAGSEIKAIKEDYHRTMGWNRGYQLGALDFEELADKGIETGMRNKLELSKDRVIYFIKTNQVNLIGSNVELPAIENKIDNEVRKLSEGVANKFNINKKNGK